jgi:hypothetical protein
MTTKDKTKTTKADEWVVHLNAVEMMRDDAAEILDDGTYVFDDGSSVYEKHRNDWRSGGKYIQCPSCEAWCSSDDDSDVGTCNDCIEAAAEETK